MTLTLQLTPWALAPLLGSLLVLRELIFLLPRHREPGTRSFLTFVVLCGLWCLLRLAVLVDTAPGEKIVLARLAMAVGALVPISLLYFSLDHAGRVRSYGRWPLILIGLATLATVALSISTGELGPSLLATFQGVTVDDFLHLRLGPGPWYWVHLGVRVLAVIMATAVLIRFHATRPDVVKRLTAVGMAAGVALFPLALQGAVDPSGTWTDVSPLGFALAAALLSLGLLRHRLLALGPISRTLVMVEMRDPIVVFDARGRIVDVNRAAERALGLEPYGDVPVPLGTLWASSGGRPGSYDRVALEVAGDERSAESRVFDITLTPLDSKGVRGRAALLLRDVTDHQEMEQEIRDANAELERLANTDELTGVANRRHFMEVLEREIQRSVRYDRPLSLIMLDLDRFKRVNDTHGHAAGDTVLEATGHALREVSRENDLPARLGGEELALLLPETTLDGAREVAERLREKLADIVHKAPDGSEFHVTASLGVATLTDETKSGDALLQRADEALYQAKEEGRDRVVVWGADGEKPGAP